MSNTPSNIPIAIRNYEVSYKLFDYGNSAYSGFGHSLTSLERKYIPYSGKVWRAECLANLLFSSVWRKKVWRINRSAKGLSMVTTNLDGFSLANCRRFAKLSRYTVLHLLAATNLWLVLRSQTEYFFFYIG